MEEGGPFGEAIAIIQEKHGWTGVLTVEVVKNSWIQRIAWNNGNRIGRQLGL